ncbi:hypothetical protein Esti_004501 [Eimeria stiedai]
MAAALLGGGSMVGHAGMGSLVFFVSAGGDLLKLDLPVEGEADPHALAPEQRTFVTSLRPRVQLVNSAVGLLILAVSAVLFLVLACVAHLQQQPGALGGAAATGLAVSGRRLAAASGSDPSSSCASNVGDGSQELQEQLELLSLPEAECEGLSQAEVRMVAEALQALKHLQRDAEAKRKLADGFRENLKKDEEELRQELAKLGLKRPIPPHLQTFRSDIATDRGRLQKMEEEALMASGALGAAVYTEQQAASVVLELALRSSGRAPAISAAAAQALVAARVVLEGPALSFPEVSAADAAALAVLLQQWLEELEGLTSNVQDSEKFLNRPPLLWPVLKQVSDKVVAAKLLSRGLSLLQLKSQAQQLLAAAEKLESSSEATTRQVQQQINAWREQTKRQRKAMEKILRQSIGSWQLPRWTQELTVVVVNRVDAVLASTSQNEEALPKLEALMLECKDILAQAAALPTDAVTADIKGAFEKALGDTEKALERLQSHVWDLWLRPVRSTAKRLTQAEKGLKEALLAAKAAHALQGPGGLIGPPKEDSETPTGKVPAQHNNILFFVSEVRGTVEEAADLAKQHGPRTAQSPPLAEGLSRLSQAAELVEQALVPAMEWLVSVWVTELDVATQGRDEAKKALKQLQEGLETDEEEVREAKRKLNRLQEKLECVLGPAMSIDRFLRQLEAPRQVTAPLMAAIKNAGGSPLAAISLSLRLDTSGQNVEGPSARGPAGPAVTLRRTLSRGTKPEESRASAARRLLRRQSLSKSLTRLTISTPSGPRPLSLHEEDEKSKSLVSIIEHLTEGEGRPAPRLEEQPEPSASHLPPRASWRRGANLGQAHTLSHRSFLSRSLGRIPEGSSSGSGIQRWKSFSLGRPAPPPPPSAGSSQGTGSALSSDEVQCSRHEPSVELEIGGLGWGPSRFKRCLGERPSALRFGRDCVCCSAAGAAFLGVRCCLSVSDQFVEDSASLSKAA